MTKRETTAKALTNKTCRQMTDLVFDYLNGKLALSVKRDFEQHLSICPDCVSFLKTYKTTVAMTRSIKAERLPPKVQKIILAFLRKRIRRIALCLFCVAACLAA